MNTAHHFALPHYSLSGLGALGLTPTQGVQIGTTLASGASPIVASSIGLTAAIGASAAIPIVGAAIAGIGLAIEAILTSGCGQTCIETSAWANQAEPLLSQNIDAYFAISPPRPQSVQQAAMQNFQNVWNRLLQLCQQPGLGQAGINCINDRNQGACKWKATTTGLYPGQPAAGQCWNWFNAYYTPIATDTQTYNDALGAAAPPSQAAAGVPVPVTGGAPNILLIVGAVGAALLLVSQL